MNATVSRIGRDHGDVDVAVIGATGTVGADDDSATGGPDIVRKIFPTAVVVSAEGAREVAPTDIESAARAIIERRAAEHEEAPR